MCASVIASPLPSDYRRNAVAVTVTVTDAADADVDVDVSYLYIYTVLSSILF